MNEALKVWFDVLTGDETDPGISGARDFVQEAGISIDMGIASRDGQLIQKGDEQPEMEAAIGMLFYAYWIQQSYKLKQYADCIQWSVAFGEHRARYRVHRMRRLLNKAGRKSIIPKAALPDLNREVDEYIAKEDCTNNQAIKAVAKRHDLKPKTLYRAMKEYERTLTKLIVSKDRQN